jgi:hypothetical protein
MAAAVVAMLQVELFGLSVVVHSGCERLPRIGQPCRVVVTFTWSRADLAVERRPEPHRDTAQTNFGQSSPVTTNPRCDDLSVHIARSGEHSRLGQARHDAGSC